MKLNCGARQRGRKTQPNKGEILEEGWLGGEEEAMEAGLSLVSDLLAKHGNICPLLYRTEEGRS